MKINLIAYLSIIVLVGSSNISATSAWDPLPPKPFDCYPDIEADRFAKHVAKIEEQMQGHLVFICNQTDYYISQASPLQCLGVEIKPNSHGYYLTKKSDAILPLIFKLSTSHAALLGHITVSPPAETNVSVLIIEDREGFIVCTKKHHESLAYFKGFSDGRFNALVDLLNKKASQLIERDAS